MKLPTGIVTKHKIRDSKILSLYATDAWTFEEIGKRFGISATRVGQIIYKNRGLLDMDRKLEKAKRVNTLRRMLKKHPENIGTKTTLDIVDQLRSETEGDPSNQPRQESSKVIIIREVVKESPAVHNRLEGITDGSSDQGGLISRSVSVIRE
jgi:predicted DNA-binding protein YlxM (UPF0122 family)